MDDKLIRRQDAYWALVEKGQTSKRNQRREKWELNGSEIREALYSVPPAEPGHIRCGLTGIIGDYLVRIQDVIEITEETGALETQRRVKELKPFMQPERKTGKKIVISYGRIGLLVCDQCGEPLHKDDTYCSNCGALMGGETSDG